MPALYCLSSIRDGFSCILLAQEVPGAVESVMEYLTGATDAERAGRRGKERVHHALHIPHQFPLVIYVQFPTQGALSPSGSDTLTATVAPSNATNRNVTWFSSNTAVATVSNGTVTAVKEGTATITATTEDGGFKATCAVTVTASQTGAVPVTAVSFDGKQSATQLSASLIVGGTQTLQAFISPANATNKNVTWSSSDASIATVTNGTVTAVKNGTATITVTTEDGGFTASCVVSVTSAGTMLTDLQLTVSDSNIEIIEGMPLDVPGLVVTAVYNDGSSKPVTEYTLSGYEAKRLGTQSITVSNGGKTASFTITVVEKKITGISITQKPTKLAYAYDTALETAGLKVSASYNDGSVSPVTTWNISGYSATTPGTQTVTVSYQGFSASFTVTVSERVSDGGVAKPVASITSYIGGKEVALSSTTPDTVIYYTLNGDVPDAGSEQYT